MKGSNRLGPKKGHRKKIEDDENVPRGDNNELVITYKALWINVKTVFVLSLD